MLFRQLRAATAGVCLSALITAAPAAGQDRLAEEEKERLAATGSGFILTSNGYIVTNHHVVADATKLGVQIPGQDKAIVAKVVVDDPEDDLAIVKIEGQIGNPPIALADPSQIRVGQDVMVLGYPLGFMLGQTVRASTGTISSLLGPQDSAGLYQISAPIQHGNSGGPVFNANGQLVGVVVTHSEDVTIQNVNFIITGTVLAKLLQKLPEGSEILRRSTKVGGTREQQIEALSKWVVQILNFHPAIATSTREYRRPQSANTRVDLLGGKMTFYVDTAKWTELMPAKAGVLQQFQMSKGEKDKQVKARLFVETIDKATTLEQARVKYLQALDKELAQFRVAKQELRSVNGVQTLTAQVDGATSDGAVEFFVQWYAGPEGSIALTGTAAPGAFEQFKPEFDEAFSGFEKPKNPSLTSAPWLTEWSRKALRKIDSPVLMRIAAREPDVPRYQKILSAFQDAAPQVYVEYVDPEKSPELAKKVGLFDVGITELNYKGRRLRTVIEAEVDVTKALMRLESGPQKVYFTQVHAERDLSSAEKDGYATLAGWLDNNNYSLERLVPTADNKVPADAAVVIAAGPKRDFTLNQITSLKQYLASGGRVLLLLDPPASASAPPLTNLIAFAKEWGVDVGGAVNEGGTDAVAAIYAAHPATLGFREPIVFPMARAVSPAGGANARGAVKLIETKQSTGLAAAVRAKPTTAAAPSLTVQPESRFTVIGDSDFVSNANLPTGLNSALFASVLAWLTEPVPPLDLSK